MNTNKLREVQALASYYRYEVRRISKGRYVVHHGFGRDLHDTALYKGSLEQVEGFVDGLRHALQTLPDLMNRQDEEGDDYNQIQSDMCEAMTKWLNTEIRRKRTEGV